MGRWTRMALSAALALLAVSSSWAQTSVLKGRTELTIAITKDVNSLDPHNWGNTLTSAVHTNMMEWLLKRDRDNNIVPWLAESYKKIDDITWRFSLRKGVTFHSGNPLTSADVQFSLMRIQEARFSGRSNYTQIKEVRIIDDLTFDIITTKPDPILLKRISRSGSNILDSKLHKKIGDEAYVRQVSGTGAYRLLEWVKDEKLVFGRNENYWGEKPVWDKVTLRVIPEESTRTAELLTGGVDVALDIPPTDIDRIKANRGTRVEGFSTSRVVYWVVNTTSKGLQDPRVRAAIDYAIDDRLIIDTIYNGYGTPVKTIVAPGVFGSNASLVGAYDYDLKKARSLLKESGFEGLAFEVASGNGQYLKDKELTELVGAMLEEAGFKPKVNILDTARFTEIKNAKQFYGIRMNGYASSMSDASTDIQPLTQASPIQFTGWLNDEFTKLYKINETLMDEGKRQANFERMQEIAAEERPLLPMLLLPGFYGVSDRLNYAPRSDEYLYFDEILSK